MQDWQPELSDSRWFSWILKDWFSFSSRFPCLTLSELYRCRLRWGAGRFVQLGKRCGFEACFCLAVAVKVMENRKIAANMLWIQKMPCLLKEQLLKSHWTFIFEEFNYLELEHFWRFLEEQWFDQEGLQTQWGRRESCMHVTARPDPDIVGTGCR